MTAAVADPPPSAAGPTAPTAAPPPTARLPPRPVPTLAVGDAVIIEINDDRQALMWAKKDG